MALIANLLYLSLLQPLKLTRTNPQNSKIFKSCIEWQELPAIVTTSEDISKRKGEANSFDWTGPNLDDLKFIVWDEEDSMIMPHFGILCNMKLVELACFLQLRKRFERQFNKPSPMCNTQPRFMKLRLKYQPPNKVHSQLLSIKIL